MIDFTSKKKQIIREVRAMGLISFLRKKRFIENIVFGYLLLIIS